MKFGSWPEEIHKSNDQRKRIQFAKSAETTPSKIDPKNQTGVFPGSKKEAYITTLESCTCVDFSRRKLPCKHMYRLGIELGLLNETAEQGINKNILNASQISLEDAVGELENFPNELQELIKNSLNVSSECKEAIFQTTRKDFYDLLRGCPLFELVPASTSEKLQYYGRNRMIEILDKNQISGFKRNSKHENLIAWCVENIENIWDIFQEIYIFRVSDCFNKARRSTYRYLLRKYDWDFGYDEHINGISYPHGAVFEDFTVTITVDKIESHWNPFVCRFPDDKITRLLTLYGYNRCLNGFDIRENNDLKEERIERTK